MIRITENEIQILKKYMPVKEINERYDIVPIKDIQKMFEEYATIGMSVKKMSEFIELPYDRVYHYYRKWKEGIPLIKEKEFNIRQEIIDRVLTYFDTHQKQSGKPWTMQDFAVNISEGLDEIPSVNFCQRLLKNLGIEWKEYK